MTTFYHVQVGALETQEFRTAPAPFWPDVTVVVPKVAERQ
jgi:hypothetical protein